MSNNLDRMNIVEGLNYQDLQDLVDDVIIVDLYKPKIGDEEDTVVVAFAVKYEEPAKDLASFIETDDLEHLDVEISSAPDIDGTWKVFVEFQRNKKLFDKIQDMLHNVENITNVNNWKYRAFKVKKIKKFTKENFLNDVVMTRFEYLKKFKKIEETSSK